MTSARALHLSIGFMTNGALHWRGGGCLHGVALSNLRNGNIALLNLGESLCSMSPFLKVRCCMSLNIEMLISLHVEFKGQGPLECYRVRIKLPY